MTASSPVTMDDLVSGLIFTDTNGTEWGVGLNEADYRIMEGSDAFNTVSISSDGLTVTFGDWSQSGPTFESFTWNG